MTSPQNNLFSQRAVADIIFAYRQTYGGRNRPLSFRHLARLLNPTMVKFNQKITHQTIRNWEDRSHLPRPGLLMHLAFHGSGWKRQLAEDLLAALRPDLYRPATHIGKRALVRSLEDTGPLKPRYDPYYQHKHELLNTNGNR